MRQISLAATFIEEQILRFAIPIVWLGPAILYIAGVVAASDPAVRTGPHAPSITMQGSTSEQGGLSVNASTGARTPEVTIHASRSAHGVAMRASTDAPSSPPPLVDAVILFMSTALTVAAAALRIGHGMVPALVRWLEQRWLSAADAKKLADDYETALGDSHRFVAYGFGLLVSLGFYVTSRLVLHAKPNAAFVARWLLCPILWMLPLVVGFWTLLRMASSVRSAIVAPATPKFIANHPDGCGGTSILGRTLIAVGSPLFVATIALAAVLFIPTNKELLGIVRVAAAVVMIALVLPSVWVVVVEPLFAAQRKIAEAVGSELARSNSAAEAIDTVYAEALAASQWPKAKEVVESGAVLRARRDALAAMRTLPISTALLAQVSVAQAASVIVVVVRILTD